VVRTLGPAMTEKILKENGQVLHLSTYQPLNKVELSDAVELARQAAFDKSITMVLGKPLTQERPEPFLIIKVQKREFGMKTRVRGQGQRRRKYKRPCLKNWIPSKPSKIVRDDVRDCETKGKNFGQAGNGKGK